MRKVDCIVIGGGPAGTFCASALADRGVECALLEKRAVMRGKVCGDGISRYGVRVLERVAFPLEPLLHYGVKVECSITIREQERTHEENWLPEPYQAAFAIGISRDALDELFLQSAVSHGVDVRLGTRVSKVGKRGALYTAGGYAAKKVVLACGAGSGLLAGRMDMLPAGISAIFQSDAARQGVFLFDKSLVYADGYAWIFSIGKNLWNVGVWSRRPQPNMKKLYQQFVRTQVLQFLGERAECVRPPKGALIGAGTKIQQWDKNIHLAGDAANGARLASGEGIPQAILSGVQTAETILREWRRP